MDTQHAKDLHEKLDGHTFAFIEGYKVRRVNQKWVLDVEQAEEHARRCAGSSQQTLVWDRLERVVETSTTSENSNKPRGVEKTRVTKAKVAVVSHCLRPNMILIDYIAVAPHS